MASSSQHFRREPELVDVIRKWSLEDSDKVKEIPMTFVSLNHYLESFRYSFIEETRAELSYFLNRVASAPHFNVHAEGFDSRNLMGLRCLSGGMVDRKAYAPREGDVILLSTVVPEDVLELKNGSAFSCLAFVTEIGRGGEGHFGVKVGAIMGCGVKSSGLALMAVFLLNIVNKSHIWNSLNVDVDDENSNLDLIKQTLSRGNLALEACPCPIQREIVSNEELVQNLKPIVLNEPQIRAICHVISSIRCSHAMSIKRISGFPGTGKTEIIAISSCIALQKKCKVIICAPTPFAVSEVVTRVFKIAGRFSSSSVFDEGFSGWPLSEIIVLGEHNQKLNMSQGFSAIYLEHRLVLLEPCFSDDSGWKKHMVSMVDFLELRVLSKCVEDDFRTGSVEVLKNNFSSVAFSLKDCILLLLKYLPSTLFSDSEVQSLSLLVSLINSMWNNLCDRDQENFHVSGISCHGVLQVLMNTLRIPKLATKQSMEHLFLRHACLIFCTSSDLSSLWTLNSFSHSGSLIVDGASELKECDSVFLLQLKGLRHAVLLGGNSYKPAICFSKILHDNGYERSLFERLSIFHPSECMLETQYRMHPAISFFPNQKFFSKQLLDGKISMDESVERPHLPQCISGAYRFLDVSDGQEICDEETKGWKNLLEAAVVCKLVSKLFKACASSREKLSVGVISPSDAQVHTIQAMLKDKSESDCGFPFWVRSAHRLECTEEDVIIISTVGSNECGSFGLLSDFRIICYCLTRARKFLWIVGSREMMKSSCSVWQEVIVDAEQRGCLYIAKDDKFLSETIFNVKSEIKQLDDLFNRGPACFTGTKWKVLIGSDFKKSFVGIQNNLMKKIIFGLLWRLACGWRPKHKKLYFSKFVKLFRAHGLMLVCTNDIVKESQFVQVLKVWDVQTLVEIPKLIQRLERMMATFSDTYVNYCRIEKFEGDLVVPMSWDSFHDSFLLKEALLPGFGNESRLRASVDVNNVGQDLEKLMQMRFYSLSSGLVKHLLTASDGQELELPFEVSDLESKIITFPESAFVVGRSGTGKTLVLLTKLMQREQHCFLARNGLYKEEFRLHRSMHYSEESGNCLVSQEHALYQIFLAVNPVLCSAVRDYAARLRRASWMTWEDTNHLFMAEKYAYISESVFKSLEELHSYFSARNFSIIQRGLIALQFYRVLWCLKEYGFSGIGFQCTKFDKSINQFKSFMFQTFFPLDCGMSMTVEHLASSAQYTVTALVTEILDMNLNCVSAWSSPMKIARVVVFLLAREFRGELCQKTHEILWADLPWRRFLQQVIYRKTDGFQITPQLLEKFMPLMGIGLESQFLLLENILFYASSCEIGRGWFITMRSCLSRFLSSKESGAYVHDLAASDIQSLKYIHSPSRSIYDFILAIAGELISARRHLWAKERNPDTTLLFKSSAMRILTLLALVCLNSGKHFRQVRKMLIDADDILLGLPAQFLLNFWHARKGRMFSLNLFGAAFARSVGSVGNQLVVVHLDDCSMSFDHLKPLYFKHSLFHHGKQHARSVLLDESST